MSMIKPNIKVFLMQIVYFILRFCLNPIFHTPCMGCERDYYVQTNMETILEIVLFSGLTFGMCYYLLKAERMFVTSFLMGFTLWILFELSKYIEYSTGFLPHYGDVPVAIGFILSLVGTTIYMGMLYLVCLLIKRLSI